MTAEPNPPSRRQGQAAWAAKLRDFVERHRALADAAPDETTRKHHVRCALRCENEAEMYAEWANTPPGKPWQPRSRFSKIEECPPGLTIEEQLQFHFAQFEEFACDKGVRFYDEHQAPGQSAEDWHMELIVRIRVEFERRRVALQKEQYWHFYDDDQPPTQAELSRPCEGCVMIRGGGP